MSLLFTAADLAEFRADAIAWTRDTCAIRRASDHWTATVATVPCHVGSGGGSGGFGVGGVIDSLSDDPFVTVWVPVTTSVAVTDRLTASGGTTYEVTTAPAHGSDDVLRALDCVEVRAQGVPS